MDREDGELFRDDLESDLNSTAAVASLNASEVARVNVGVGGVATGIALYVLSFLTFVGNAMVLHAIRTEKRLQTVSDRARDGEGNAFNRVVVSYDSIRTGCLLMVCTWFSEVCSCPFLLSRNSLRQTTYKP